jgi:nucleoside-diphosphate-sugar epimerase
MIQRLPLYSYICKTMPAHPTILVTGATGLLGSHLLYSLVSDKLPVRAIKRPASRLDEVKKVFSFYSPDYEELFNRVEWVNADILAQETLFDVFAGIGQVYHCAAFVSFDPRDRARLIRNNTEGTANVVNTCLELNIGKLCHVSSTSALGRAPEGELITEEMLWTSEKRNTGYGISKFKSEMEAWRGIEEGLNSVIVNPSIILGPGFWDKGSSSMFSTIKKGLRFYTNGVTGYVGVNDVVTCMRRLMESDISGERFILSSENLSYREVFTMIATALGKKPPTLEATPFLGGIAWRLDAFRSFFGFKRVITREAVSASRSINRFSNEKICKGLDFRFQPIETVIKEVARFY